MNKNNKWRKGWWIGMLLGLWACTAWSGVLCEEKKTEQGARIEVTTPSYKIAIDPQKAGHIASWVPAGTQEELAHCGLGIANLVRQSTSTDFELAYVYEIRKHAQLSEAAPEKVEVILRSGAANREKLDGLEFCKTLIFRSNTPYIQIHTEITNFGGAKSMPFRIYNDIRVGAKGTAMSFHRGAATLLKNPSLAKKWEVWKDAGDGWGGAGTGSGLSVIAKMRPEVVTYADDRSAAYEVRFKPCAMDRGETADVGDVFLAAVKAKSAEDALKQAGSPGFYAGEVREIAEARPVDRKAEVTLGKDSRRILLVGRSDRYGFYRVKEALAKSPGMDGQVDQAPVVYSSTKQIYGFPVSAQGFARYRMIVFIDTPHFILPDASWNLVDQFARAGGTVVFVGDHAADYEGKSITGIMPARFDYTKSVEAGPEKLKGMDDRSGYADLEPAAASDPLLMGLDFSSKPQACVHKSVLKKDAVVRMKAGRWPVLASWKVGNGMVHSFPVCLTDKYHMIYDVDEPEYRAETLKTFERKSLSTELGEERAKSIFLWSDYGELWTRIAGAGSPNPKKGTRMATPSDGSFTFLLGNYKGLTRVYRRDYDVPYELAFGDKAGGKLALHLTDPWGKEVWTGEMEAVGRKSGVVPLKGLAVGHYVLKAQLGKEIEGRDFDVLADLDRPDGFDVTTLGCGAYRTDDPEEQAQLASEVAAEGLNLLRGAAEIWHIDFLRWPARHRRAWGDRVMLAGMVPLHYDIFIGQSGAQAHQTDEQIREEIRKSQDFFDYAWGMAPEGIPTYIYDEPCHSEAAKDCRPCREDYSKRYGGGIPKEKSDPGYYRLMKIMDQAMIDSLVRKGKLWKGTNSKMKLWGLTNEGGGLMEHAVFMARAFGGYGMDFFSYSPGNWKAQYAFDMALAASDFDPASLAFQVEAESFYGGTPVASQRGQSAYSCLARGCRVLQWWDWDHSRLKHDVGLKVRHYECVKQATQEAHKLGPVLAGMKRPKGQVAMLVPTAAFLLGEGEAWQRNEKTLMVAYKAAQVSCGNVDFLYYQHLREGKLSEYPVLLLAGNDWIDEEMLGIIGKWVAAGGTLLVMPKSGTLSEELKPTRFFTETCPVKYGDKSASPKVKGFADPMLMAYQLESASGEAMYSYDDGKPAAYRFAQGSGRVVVFGFAPENARVLETIFGDLKLDPSIARSDDPDASAGLLKSGESTYCVAVNSEEKAKDVELILRVEGTGVPTALDMLTGKKVEVVRDTSGRVKMHVAMEPFWGRAVALLPAQPAKVAIEVPEKARPGEESAYRVRVLDGKGKVISGRIPLEISAVDSSGRPRKECGGYHVTEDGIYEKKIRLGTNDPTGTWKITAAAPWGGIKAQAGFKVGN